MPTADPAAPVRIAMWSGPRNISTAMMRAWENRPDTAVWDEPLYAYYLAATGLEHPGREAVIEAGGGDWRAVATACSTGPAPGGRAVFYQKHMTHHLLPEVDFGWLRNLRHALLIREPSAVLRSYTRTRDTVTLDDIGLARQVALYEYLCGLPGEPPPVVDSADFLRKPRDYLRALCAAFGLDFSERMLNWPAGRRDSDGVWGDYWYHSVWRSTGFAKPAAAGSKTAPAPLPPPLARLAERAQPLYRQLYGQRLVL